MSNDKMPNEFKPSTRQQLKQLAVAHKALLEAMPEALHLSAAGEQARQDSLAACQAIISGKRSNAA